MLSLAGLLTVCHIILLACVVFSWYTILQS